MIFVFKLKNMKMPPRLRKILNMEEIYYPDGSNDYLTHLERYKFATQFVKGKVVLDNACGVGYGSDWILKHAAKNVYGIDISEEAIKFAKNNFSGDFSVRNALDSKFPDNFFDVVVSMVTFEHVKNGIRFLEEIKRVLKPKGKVIIATTNYKKNIFSYSYHHRNSMKKNEFIKLFSSFFKNVTFYGQGKWFHPFIGRGLIEKLIGYKRDVEKIYDLDKYSFPRFVIGVGTNKK